MLINSKKITNIKKIIFKKKKELLSSTINKWDDVKINLDPNLTK